MCSRKKRTKDNKCKKKKNKLQGLRCEAITLHTLIVVRGERKSQPSSVLDLVGLQRKQVMRFDIHFEVASLEDHLQLSNPPNGIISSRIQIYFSKKFGSQKRRQKFAKQLCYSYITSLYGRQLKSKGHHFDSTLNSKRTFITSKENRSSNRSTHYM